MGGACWGLRREPGPGYYDLVSSTANGEILVDPFTGSAGCAHAGIPSRRNVALKIS
jgi:hypothetical protein